MTSLLIHSQPRKQFWKQAWRNFRYMKKVAFWQTQRSKAPRTIWEKNVKFLSSPRYCHSNHKNNRNKQQEARIIISCFIGARHTFRYYRVFKTAWKVFKHLSLEKWRLHQSFWKCFNNSQLIFLLAQCYFLNHSKCFMFLPVLTAYLYPSVDDWVGLLGAICCSTLGF